MANELGRLAQGVGNDTITFIQHEQVPNNKMPKYARIVCDIRPQKDETHRTRITVGGNLVDYQGNVSTPTAEISTAKLLFNSVISTPNARFMTCDIKNFYLNSIMPEPEYMKMPLEYFS
jgi:hypothetical protein